MNTVYWIWFAERVSHRNKYARELILKYEDPKIIYDMTYNDLIKLDINDSRLIESLSDKNIEKETDIINICSEKGYNIFPYNHMNYPDRFREIEDFPYVIYHRGNIYNFKDSFAISIVGTRKSSCYGDETAYNLGRELSEGGAIIVSGMALGIDGYAHKGAMSVDKPTVAVLGSGIDVIQPYSNKALYEYMISNGAVYSEYPPGTPGLPAHFPVRNRLISALSVGVVVVEAELKSGSLITAEYALEQGKDVFAVPNTLKNPKGKGTNNLIKNGAYIVTSSDDIFDEYKDMFVIEKSDNENSSSETNKAKAEFFIGSLSNITPFEMEILNCLKDMPLTVDSIINFTGLPVEKVVAAMTILEIKDAVKTVSGNKFALNIERNG